MNQLPQPAVEIVRAMQKAGYECYAVGGSVRDILLDRPTHGWDFTTNATPEQILAVFPDSFYDNQFGTVGIKIRPHFVPPGGTSRDKEKEDVVDIYEMTTYRSEKGYTDRRHPDTITWGKTLTEDLSRRDFTISAIAFDGKTFVDPYGGRQDLAAKVIKAVGTANDRFAEDALRMMRAIRIASQLGFTIEPTTLAAITTNAQLITEISWERITNELMKILASDYPADGILMLKSTGLLHFILPELSEAFAIGQKSPKRHHIYDVGTHSVMALKYCPTKDPVVRLATLLHDIGKPKTVRTDENGVVTFFNHEVAGFKIARSICDRLRLGRRDREKILTLVRWHQFTVDERQTDSALRRFIRHVGVENLADMLALRIGDRLGGGAQETSWRLELFKKRLEEVQKLPFTVADLKINGHDVMAELACQPGPIIGKTLNALFAEVEAGTLPNEREALLKRLQETKES